MEPSFSTHLLIGEVVELLCVNENSIEIKEKKLIIVYEMHATKYKYLLLFLLLLTGCYKKDGKPIRGEFLIRHHDEILFTPPDPLKLEPPAYPWERRYVGGYPRITKEFFRCKGNSLNPVVIQKRGEKETLYHRDCSDHGLPLKNGEEFIYPCLIHLLNTIQEKLGKRVVITSGHRCPEHNTYCDYSPYNWGSKHMLGAEVDFYVEGLEEEPEKVIELIMNTYSDPFKRYAREGLDITTPPWFNDEIFIKLYLPHEGRDFDNQHPYPYIGVQVRFDEEEGKRVTYSPEQAQNYLRH